MQPDDVTSADESRTIGWDEATRPRVEDQPSSGNDDSREVGQGEHLVLIHDMYRQQLAAIRRLRDDVKQGVADVGALRGQISELTLRQGFEQFGAYCAQYCRAVNVHHTIEDRHMFPELREAEPRLAGVLDRLSDEHVAIHRVLVDLDLAAVELAETGEGFDEVDRLVDVLESGLLSHLRYEEDQLVRPLGRHPIVI